MKKTSAYAKAGVDIDKKMAGISAIKKMADSTGGRGVLSGIGLFGGMFQSPGTDKALVASADGVGTKLKVAAMAGRHDTVGQDIVNHCVNDILVQGAKPLFFLDYIGTSSFNGKMFQDVVSGLCKACRENNCALLGGETAEMPGLYPPGEYDLVGTIVGVVDKKKIITGRGIKPGDVLIGLPSSGLHTNGYSLARKVIFKTAKLRVTDKLPGTVKTVADALLAVHRSYLKPVSQVLDKVKVHGMAHITGGGFQDNLPRVLPKDAVAVIDRRTWKVPRLFQFIQEKGKVDRDEMYRVFNMGIGYIIIVSKKDESRTMSILGRTDCTPVIIGHIEKGQKRVRLVG